MDKITTTVTMTLADFREREKYIEELKEQIGTEKQRYLNVEHDYYDACTLLKYWSHTAKGKGIKLPLRSPSDRRFLKKE